jgi:hypothetical protein
MVRRGRLGGNDKFLTIPAKEGSTRALPSTLAEMISKLSLLPSTRCRTMALETPPTAFHQRGILMSTFTAPRTEPQPQPHPEQGGNGTGSATWRFVRHYLEMVLAMLAGMAVLGTASSLLVDLPDSAAVELVEMAVWMTVPMVAWMRFRGHGWRATNEMAAAMLVPAAGALALLGAGVVTDAHALVMLEHTAMFPAMLVAMLLRRSEYTGHHHATSQATAAA